jgi:hypothetical protein
VTSESIVEAVRTAFHEVTHNDAFTHEEAEFLAQTAVSVAKPIILAEVGEKLTAIRELHKEDLFRGHLSNGCKTCGHGDGLGYPCPTIIALDALTLSN